MAQCNITELTTRGVIKVSGSDAKKFLQDIVTNDVAKAVDGKAVHAGLLMPQGKILFDFFLLDRGDHFLLECARDNTADLIKRLTFYKLRAAVELEDLSGTLIVWPRGMAHRIHTAKPSLTPTPGLRYWECVSSRPRLSM